MNPKLIPWVFVWIWSTGFIAAKYGLPYAEPFTLLSYRFVITLFFLLILIIYKKSPWPETRLDFFHLLIAGVLIHGVYLGGVFQALKWGMPAGLGAMVIGLQPIGMALVAGVLLKEEVSKKQWTGLIMGLVGLYLVLFDSLDLTEQIAFDGFPIWAVFAVIISLFAISIGTIYQKRFCSNMNLYSGAWVQYFSASILCILIVLFFDCSISRFSFVEFIDVSMFLCFNAEAVPASFFWKCIPT